MELHELTIGQLADELATKKVSCREVIEHILNRIEEFTTGAHQHDDLTLVVVKAL